MPRTRSFRRPPPLEAVRLPISVGTGVGLFPAHLSLIVSCSIILRFSSSTTSALFLLAFAVRKLGGVRRHYRDSRRMNEFANMKSLTMNSSKINAKDCARDRNSRPPRSETPLLLHASALHIGIRATGCLCLAPPSFLRSSGYAFAHRQGGTSLVHEFTLTSPFLPFVRVSSTASGCCVVLSILPAG